MKHGGRVRASIRDCGGCSSGHDGIERGGGRRTGAGRRQWRRRIPEGGSAAAGIDVAAGAPTTFANIDVNGGYVAAGVGLRNRGAGTITISGIPSGAVVQAAYLYWSVLGGAAEPATFRSADLQRDADDRHQGRLRRPPRAGTR